MKKIIIIITLILCNYVFATNSVTVVTNAATDIRTTSYSTKLMRWEEIHNIKDATPAVLILPKPTGSAYTNRVSVLYIDGYTNVTTNVEYSISTPVSWDTTLWPWANSDGISYGIAVITNPPTRPYSYGSSTNTLPISNLWINPIGTSNGWILIN